MGWLPAFAVLLAVVATIAGVAGRADDDAPVARRALPFLLLFVAAILAVVSTAAESVFDSRIGIREVSTGCLAILFGTPALGWIAARARWGSPGRRTFHQQIAANRASSVVLIVVLVEVLALTGFVIGATFGAAVRNALAGGMIVGAGAVVLGLGAAVVVVRRGPNVVLHAVGARPLDDRDTMLRNVVVELSIAAAIQPPSLYLISNAAPNAFAVGTNPDRAAIVVTTGLLQQLDREELQGVIAHEIAHIRNLDSRYGLFVAVIVGAVILVAVGFATLVSGASIEADSFSGLLLSIAVAIIATLFGWLVRTCATLAARAVQASVSREREFLADATSVEITRNPAGLIRALTKIDGAQRLVDANAGTQHLWFVSPLAGGGVGSSWFSTHPSSSERIARLGDLGRRVDEAEQEPSA
jgi:heat shock protein HtpX